jgi:uncharacterized protein YlxW (UPF0749 family)
MHIKLFLATSCICLLAGCSSTESVSAKNGSAAERAAERELREDLARSKRELSKRLDQLDLEIDKLEVKTKKASKEAKAKLIQQTSELKVETAKLRRRLATWGEKAEVNWKAATREVEADLDRFEANIRKLLE